MEGKILVRRVLEIGKKQLGVSLSAKYCRAERLKAGDLVFMGWHPRSLLRFVRPEELGKGGKS